MNLDKRVGKSLERVKPDRPRIRKLLAAAERNIADAHIAEVSFENRFDAAYKAIMQLANALLYANGYRTLSSKPGHHRAMMQSLGEILGLDKRTMIFLDALRKQRNLSDYSGDPVTESAVDDCISQARWMYEAVMRWLRENKPEFLE